MPVIARFQRPCHPELTTHDKQASSVPFQQVSPAMIGVAIEAGVNARLCFRVQSRHLSERNLHYVILPQQRHGADSSCGGERRKAPSSNMPFQSPTCLPNGLPWKFMDSTTGVLQQLSMESLMPALASRAYSSR
jgi:hypothetical protein